MRQFSMGMAYALPSGANPTPIPFAILSDVKWSIKQTKKYISGAFEAPIDAGGGPVDNDISISSMDFRASIIAALLAGVANTTGGVLPVTSEAATVPSTPFQYTVTQTATFKEDAAVFDFTASKWLVRVASAPATGQYAVSNVGVYTFAAADTGHLTSIAYSYTTTLGFTSTYTNRTMTGSTGVLLRCYNQYNVGGTLRNLGVDFLNVHLESLDMTLKVGDWAQQAVKGKAIQDTASSIVWRAYVGE